MIGKEKLDSIKRPKTGGGPPLPPLTQGEETFLRLSEAEPNIHGLEGGVDTDAPTEASALPAARSESSRDAMQAAEQSSSGFSNPAPPAATQREVMPAMRKRKKSEPRSRKLEELEEKNFELDNQRLQEQILTLREERELMKIQKEVQTLKKQKLLLDIQTSFPDFLVQLTSEL